MAERILLVEDEEKLARMVELELQYEGYEVEKAFDGRAGLDRALSGEFDLVLLDIMAARPVRHGGAAPPAEGGGYSSPVIMLTARDSVVDKVSGLDSGGGRLYHQALRHRGAAGPHPGGPAEAGERRAAGGAAAVRRSPDHGRGAPHRGSVRDAGGADPPGVRPAPPPAGEQGQGAQPGGPAGQACGASTSWGRPTRWTYISVSSAARSTRPLTSS